MNTTKTDYVPALGHDGLSLLYDVVMRQLDAGENVQDLLVPC